MDEKLESNGIDRQETIFHAALHLTDAEQRRVFLDMACGGNAQLRARIERLLASADDTFLENGIVVPQAELAARASDKTTPDASSGKNDSTGERIGRYKLLQKIGEGGCGIVYMAEQLEPVRRRVAVKVIKLGMDTQQVIARFEAERQALALMDHPNIARVLDAGATDTGRPYFVMELVKGIPITRFCDENNLSTEARLHLFLQVCQALQHAHQKGIIHRDIKPSNVLVADYDGVPVPKIIDFGIAKATSDQRLTDRTLFTAFEQFIGTPAYMSPEQARLSGLDVDTRSDIYSLGVLLYELLIGKTPFEPKRLLEAGLDEVRRILQEEEPAPPSTRLNTLDNAEQTTVARHRQADPPRLAHLIRGDLDWIVMKALEKDRNRRYETANALALDIQRHLNNEPVLAGPPSASYRFQKIVRRHRILFAAGSAVALALSVGLAFATWAFVRERAAYGNARRLLYVADLNLAQQAWEQNNTGAINNLLDETRSFPDRGFEWFFWRRQTHLSQQTLRGHFRGINSISLSSDGKRIASGSGDSTVKVWDRETGRELLTCQEHSGLHIHSVAFSPDGSRIVAATFQKGVKVWDASNGRELFTYPGQTGWIHSVAFSPDGRQIASSANDGTVKVWDAATGQDSLSLTGTVSQAVAFSPDGTRLAVGSDDYVVRIREVATGQELHSLRGHALYISAIAYSSDGKRIVTGSWDKTAKVWDPEKGVELTTFREHADHVLAVAFSPDGKLALSSGRDHTARIWDPSTGRERRILKDHTASVGAVAFTQDGAQVITGSEDQTIKIWDAQNDPERLTLKLDANDCNSLAVSSDGQRIAAGGTGQIKIVDRSSGRELVTLRGHGTIVSSVAFSPDGQRVLSGGWDNTGKVWDAVTGRELFTLNLTVTGPNITGPNIQVRSVAFSPDGQRIATGCGDVTAKVWDAATGRELLHFGDKIVYLTYSPDGRTIATGGWDFKIRLFQADTGREMLTLPSPSAPALIKTLASGWKTQVLPGHSSWIVSLAFFPDGKRIVSASLDGTAKIWDIRTGRELLTLKGHSDALRAVAVSPDGRRVLTGSSDRTAKLWDATCGRELLTFRGHNGEVRAVAFSPDGLAIVTGGGDGNARIWLSATPAQSSQWQRDDEAFVVMDVGQSVMETRVIR